MLKAILLSAAMTTILATGAFAQTQPQTAPASPTAPMTTAPMTTTPATPSATAPTIGAIRGSTLINMDVKNSADEKIGGIDDVIVGADGKVEQVIISVGGFLGVGTRKVAVAWNEVKVDTNADVAWVNLSKQQLEIAPEFKDRRTKP